MPKLVDIPGKGVVEFPDEMDDDSISRAIRKDFLKEEQAQVRKRGKRLESGGKVLEAEKQFAENVNLGQIGRVAKGFTADMLRSGIPLPGEPPPVPISTAQALIGKEEPDVSDLSVVQQGLTDAARTAPTIGGAMALQALGVPLPAGFAIAAGAETFGETESPLEAGKSAAIAAAIPGVGKAGRAVAAKALGKAVDAGLLSGSATTTQKAIEALTSQGAIQAFIEGVNLPVYLEASPEERREMLIRNLVANTAFLALDVTHVIGKGPSATQAKLPANAKVGHIVAEMLNDPATVQALDEAAFRIAQQEARPENAQRTAGEPLKFPEPIQEASTAEGKVPTAEIEAPQTSEIRTQPARGPKEAQEPPVEKPEQAAQATKAPEPVQVGKAGSVRGGSIPETVASVEQATLPRRIEAPALDTGEPVSLAGIRQYLSQALDIPIRFGVGRRSVAGFFRPKEETIRTRAVNDIPTIAHEVGHYLHWILFPGKQIRRGVPVASEFEGKFDSELLGLGQRTSRGNYTPEQVRREGVAEFTREYLTDRGRALEKAPKFTEFFESSLRKDFPEVWKIVTQARKELGRYINQPATAKVMSMISRKSGQAGMTFTRLWNSYKDGWQNDLGPAERAADDLVRLGAPREKAQDFKDLIDNVRAGWQGKVEYSFQRAQLDHAGNEVGPPLKKILSGVEDMDEFRAYLVSKRALEMDQRGIQTGIDARDAGDVVRDLAGRYESKRAELRKWSRNELKLLVDAGFYSKQEAATIEAANEFFVPFHRVYEAVSGRGGRGSSQQLVDLPSPLRRFTGDTRQIIDPLESIVKDAYLHRSLAERNRAMQLFDDMLRDTRGSGRIAEDVTRKIKPQKVTDAEARQFLIEIGVLKEGVVGKEAADAVAKVIEGRNLGFRIWRSARTTSAKDGIFSIWRDGKERFLQTGDTDLYNALLGGDAQVLRVVREFPVLKPFRSLTRTLRAGATLTPEFMQRNIFKDSITAPINSEYGFVPVVDTFRGLLTAVGRGDEYFNWLKAGGRYADFVSMDRTDLQKTLDDVIRDPVSKGEILKMVRNPLLPFQRASEFIEMANRIGEFQRAKAKGASDLRAAVASKQVTLPFHRGGKYSRAVNQLVAFFNASMLDFGKVARQHVTHPIRTASKAFALITAPTIANWWMHRDDEAYQKLPEWRRMFFWNMNLGRMAGGEDVFFSFPKPFLYGHLYGTSAEAALDRIHGKDPNALRKWFAGMVQITPTGSADPGEALANMAPTGIRPFLEAHFNESIFRGRELESQGLRDLPVSERFRPGTSETAKFVSRMLTEAGVIDPVESHMSPVKIDNTIRGLFGGIGRYGTDAVDWVIAKSRLADVPEPPAKRLLEQPGLRAFTQSPFAPNEFVRRFYDAAKRAEQRLEMFRSMPEMMGSENDRKYFQREREQILFYLGQAGAIRDAREILNLHAKTMRQIQLSKTLSAEDKREKLLELTRQRNRLAEEFFNQHFSERDKRRVF